MANSFKDNYENCKHIQAQIPNLEHRLYLENSNNPSPIRLIEIQASIENFKKGYVVNNCDNVFKDYTKNNMEDIYNSVTQEDKNRIEGQVKKQRNQRIIISVTVFLVAIGMLAIYTNRNN
jgi:hypothetical protein